MNSTSESDSRDWRFKVGVLRWSARDERGQLHAVQFAEGPGYSTVRSWLPSSIRMMRVGLRVWRASAARQSEYCFFVEGGDDHVDGSVAPVCRRIGDGLVRAWIRPMMLSTVFG